MKTILILGNNDGGLYRFRRELIETLLTKEYKVFISTPYGDYIPELEKMGCEYKELDYNRLGKNPLKEITLLFSYHKIIKECKCDLVLLYTIKPTLYAGIVCRVKKIPYIVTITGLSQALSVAKIIRKLCFMIYRFVLRHADCVFFQNKTNMDLFAEENAIKENACLIPGSGVNLNENKYEEYSEDDKFRILYVGRITRIKGITELLDAIDILKKCHKNLVFEFVGECDEHYEKQIKQLHEEKKIVYYGVSKNPHENMRKAQAVIMPSYGEGMSNVLLEAAACGRPILASDVPGCREIVLDGVTGFSFSPHKADSIIDAVEKLIFLTKEKREKMGKMGREHVERTFSREIIINKYMEEIQKVLGR